MKVERYQPTRKRNTPLLGCGCAALTLMVGTMLSIVMMLTLPDVLPRILMSVTGFESVGETDTLLDVTPQTVPTLAQRGIVTNQVVIAAEGYQQAISGNGIGYTMQAGSSDGVSELQITLTEEGLLTLCRQVTDLCDADGTQGFRDLRFDLRSGGMVVRGDVELQAGFWQRIGVVVQVSGSQLTITGIEVDGQVYAPSQSDFAAPITEAQTLINRVIRTATATIGAESYTLHALYPQDNQITLILRR